MNSKKGIWFFAALVVLVPALAFAIVAWTEARFRPVPVLGDASYHWQDYAFVSETGKKVVAADWQSSILVAHFFFSHCPAVCPKMVEQLKTLRSITGNDVVILSFTVDPDRDSAARLMEYARQQDIPLNNWELLTGDKVSLYRFARKNLQLAVTDGDGGPEDFIHSDRLVLIDRLHQIRGYYQGTDAGETARLKADIHKLEKE